MAESRCHVARGHELDPVVGDRGRDEEHPGVFPHEVCVGVAVPDPHPDAVVDDLVVVIVPEDDRGLEALLAAPFGHVPQRVAAGPVVEGHDVRVGLHLPDLVLDRLLELEGLGVEAEAVDADHDGELVFRECDESTHELLLWNRFELDPPALHAGAGGFRGLVLEKHDPMGLVFILQRMEQLLVHHGTQQNRQYAFDHAQITPRYDKKYTTPRYET